MWRRELRGLTENHDRGLRRAGRLLPAAPCTDPYAKYYLIRLLLLVERGNDLSDKDVESSAAAGSDQQVDSFDPMVKHIVQENVRKDGCHNIQNGTEP